MILEFQGEIFMAEEAALETHKDQGGTIVLPAEEGEGPL